MIIQGRLLTDAGRPPRLGWLRIDGHGIAEVRTGELPGDLAPPTLGGRSHLVTPAFYDAHIHLPQIDSAGCDGLPLLEWLREVVFPAESWWGRGQALALARTAVGRMVRHGTAGFAGYLTSHGAINREVLGLLASKGPQRFIAGRVAMDRNAPPELIGEDTQRLKLSPTPSPTLPPIEGRFAGHARVSANPRFAVACSDELLAEIGWAAADRPGLVIQTHLAESPDELASVAELFPDDAHYTGVYDRAKLLTPRTLLAHCVHLSRAEWALIRERDAVVVHCPTANMFLRSGLFDLDAARDHGVRLALGSDVAGGPDVAMPRVARAMIETAKLRALAAGGGVAGVHIPSPAEAWRQITRGNAAALGWDDAGQLAPGADADVLVLGVPDTWFDEHLVGRLLYNWDADLIHHRVVAGRVVDPREPFGDA